MKAGSKEEVYSEVFKEFVWQKIHRETREAQPQRMDVSGRQEHGGRKSPPGAVTEGETE